MMRHPGMVTAVIAALVLALGGAPAFGQTPPSPATPYLFRTAGLPLAGPYEVAQLIDVFPPGATTAWHRHPGLVLVTVLAGELTVRLTGTERVYTTGESVVEVPDQVRQATNWTPGQTRLLVSIVLPRGAPLSVPDAGRPARLPGTGVAGAPGSVGVATVVVGLVLLLFVVFVGVVWGERRRPG